MVRQSFDLCKGPTARELSLIRMDGSVKLRKGWEKMVLITLPSYYSAGTLPSIFSKRKCKHKNKMLMVPKCCSMSSRNVMEFYFSVLKLATYLKSHIFSQLPYGWTVETSSTLCWAVYIWLSIFFKFYNFTINFKV